MKSRKTKDKIIKSRGEAENEAFDEHVSAQSAEQNGNHNANAEHGKSREQSEMILRPAMPVGKANASRDASSIEESVRKIHQPNTKKQGRSRSRADLSPETIRPSQRDERCVEAETRRKSEDGFQSVLSGGGEKGLERRADLFPTSRLPQGPINFTFG